MIYVSYYDSYSNYSKLILNDYTLKANIGKYYDLIELYNGNKFDNNLKGYYLSDDEYWTDKWQFPNIIIKAKSYLVMFASEKIVVMKLNVILILNLVVVVNL